MRLKKTHSLSLFLSLTHNHILSLFPSPNRCWRIYFPLIICPTWFSIFRFQLPALFLALSVTYTVASSSSGCCNVNVVEPWPWPWRCAAVMMSLPPGELPTITSTKPMPLSLSYTLVQWMLNVSLKTKMYALLWKVFSRRKCIVNWIECMITT